MADITVTIEWEGKEQVTSNLDKLADPARFEKAMAKLAGDTEKKWVEITPRRKGRLQEGDKVTPQGLSFEMKNEVYYSFFVERGHMTPRGWQRPWGYQPAKRRSRVEGRHMTDKALEWVGENILEYVAKAMMEP